MIKQISQAVADVGTVFEQTKLDRISKMRAAREHLVPLVNRANDKEVKDRGKEKALNRALGVVEGLFLAGLLTKDEDFDWRHWCEGDHHQPKLEDEVRPSEPPDFDDSIPF